MANIGYVGRTYFSQPISSIKWVAKIGPSGITYVSQLISHAWFREIVQPGFCTKTFKTHPVQTNALSCPRSLYQNCEENSVPVALLANIGYVGLPYFSQPISSIKWVAKIGPHGLGYDSQSISHAWFRKIALPG